MVKMNKIVGREAVGELIGKVKQIVSLKADKAATLEGYGIKDAYTKTEIDELIARLQESEEGHFFKAEENEF